MFDGRYYKVSNDELAEFFVDEEAPISGEIQDVQSVFVQTANITGDSTTLVALQNLRQRYVQKLQEVDTDIQRIRGRVDIEIKKLKSDTTRYLESIDTHNALLYGMQQMTTVFAPRILRDSVPAAIAARWFFMSYLSKEKPIVDLDLSMERRFPVFDGRPLSARTFHDEVGRRFIVYSSQVEMLQEDKNIEAVVDQYFRNSNSEFVGIMQNYIRAGLGLDAIYRKENSRAVQLYESLRAAVRQYYDFNIDKYLEMCSILFESVRLSKVVCLLHTESERRKAITSSRDYDAIHTLLDFRHELDRDKLLNLYKHWTGDEVTSVFRGFFRNFKSYSSARVVNQLNPHTIAHTLRDFQISFDIYEKREEKLSNSIYSAPPPNFPLFLQLLVTRNSRFIEYLATRAKTQRDHVCEMTNIASNELVPFNDFLPCSSFFNPLYYVQESSTRKTATLAINKYINRVWYYNEILRRAAPPKPYKSLWDLIDDEGDIKYEKLGEKFPDFSNVDVLVRYAVPTQRMHFYASDYAIFKLRDKETLGAYTRRTATMSFFNSADESRIVHMKDFKELDISLRDDLSHRVHKLFDVLHDIVITGEKTAQRCVRATLLYIYARFTEHYRGVDIDNDAGSVFEAWIMTLSGMKKIGDTVQHKDTLAEELYQVYTRGANFWWHPIILHYDKPVILDDVLAYDDNNNNQMLETQLAILKKLYMTSGDLVRAFVSVLLPHMSPLHSPVPWVNVKTLLYELHPRTLQRLLIFNGLHSGVPPETVKLPHFVRGRSWSLKEFQSHDKKSNSLNYLETVMEGLANDESSFQYEQVLNQLGSVWSVIYPMCAMQEKFNKIMDLIISVCDASAPSPRNAPRGFFPIFTAMRSDRTTLSVYVEVLSRINDLSTIPRLDAVVAATQPIIPELQSSYEKFEKLRDREADNLAAPFTQLFRDASENQSLQLAAEGYLSDAKNAIMKAASSARFSRDLKLESLRTTFQRFSAANRGTPAEYVHTIVARYTNASRVFMQTAVHYCRSRNHEFRSFIRMIFDGAETFSAIAELDELITQFVAVYITNANDEKLTRVKFLSSMRIDEFGIYEDYVRWLVENMSMPVNDIVQALRDLHEFVESEMIYVSMLATTVLEWLTAFLSYGNGENLRDFAWTLKTIKEARQVKHLFAFLDYLSDNKDLPPRIPTNVGDLVKKTLEPRLRSTLSKMFIDVQHSFSIEDVDRLLAAVRLSFQLYPYDNGQVKLACRSSSGDDRDEVKSNIDAVSGHKSREALHATFSGLCVGLVQLDTEDKKHYLTAAIIRKYLEIVSSMEIVTKVASDPKLYDEAREATTNTSLSLEERDGIRVFERLYVERVRQLLEDFWNKELFSTSLNDAPIQELIDGDTLYKFGVHRHLTFSILNTIRICTELPDDARPREQLSSAAASSASG